MTYNVKHCLLFDYQVLIDVVTTSLENYTSGLESLEKLGN